MNRGINKRHIFKNHAEKECLLALFDDVSTRFSAHIHGYCIMSNHYHLLLQTPNANLSRIMRHIDGAYTQAYHRLQKRYSDGPIFRGRYKAKLIGEIDYLLNVSRYIHLNPTEANLTNTPENYPWSSCSFYYGIKASPSWLHYQTILEKIGGLEQYQQFLLYGNSEETIRHYQHKHWLTIFGSDEFTQNQLNNISPAKAAASKADIARLTPPANYSSLDEIAFTVAEAWSTTISALAISHQGYGNMPRKMAAYIAYQYHGYELAELTNYFQWKSRTATSSALSRFAKQVKDDGELQQKIISILRKLAST